MTAEPLSFFTIDHGTASVAASLVAPIDGRFRLLAFAAAPSGVPTDALLEDLVGRVVAADREALPTADGFADWARLESRTRAPIGVVCAGVDERRVADMARALAGAGWEVRERWTLGDGDQLALAERCLDPEIHAVAIACGPSADGDERSGLPVLGALVGAMAGQRDDLWVLLSGGATAYADPVPPSRRVPVPAPTPGVSSADSALRSAAIEVANDLAPQLEDPPLPDGRVALRTSVETLARLLDRRVEAVDVGHAAGSRTLAHPSGVVGHLVSAEGALVPASAMRDDREIDGILRWSAVRSDQFTLADRVRNLRLAPWRDAAGEGARLRLSVLRAALARLQAGWELPPMPSGRPMPAGADLLVACGGAFGSVPPPGAALALVDTFRRPGAMAIFHDHARMLAPIGVLGDETDRRRLLADLLDDILLPLGSAVIAGDVRAGRRPGTLRVSSPMQRSVVELAPGSLRLMDLPPGVPARVEIETRDGALLGVRSRHVVLEVTGGLGGLLVDTREVPLRLPDRVERRRALLESWERAVWATSAP